MAKPFTERNITEFRSRLSGGGARSNLFEVEIAFPEGLGVDSGLVTDKVPFLVKAAEIPASNLGNIPVPYRGRVLPVAGDRTFDPWTVTIINDTDFLIRDAMEKWSNSINDLQTAQGTIDPAVYQQNAFVRQLLIKHNIKEVTTQRQAKNGTREFEFPVPARRRYYHGELMYSKERLRLACFTTGYVRNQNSCYSNYQLNPTYKRKRSGYS